jgi:APA family basic amino acid/polyamine antiporter
MADDGLFPQWLRLRGEVPRAAIALQAALVILVIVFSSLKGLLTYLGLTLSLCTALAISTLFILQRRADEKIKVAGYPFTPAFYIFAVLCFTLLSLRRNPMEMLGTVVTVLSGLLVYMLVKR